MSSSTSSAAPPDAGIGARTWRDLAAAGSPASVRSQVAACAVVGAAIGLVAVAAPSIAGWVVATLVSLVVGVAIAMVGAPLRIFDRLAGAMVGVIAAVVALAADLFLSSIFHAMVVPAAAALLVAVFVIGLDWRRVERLQALVTASGAIVLIASMGDPGWIYVLAAGWLAAAFGTYALLEGDRRAALPRVQPDARAAAADPKRSDLATALLVAAAIGLLAALVLSVPACERRMDLGSRGGSSSASGGAGEGSGQERGGGGRGSGGAGQGSGRGGGTASSPDDHRYVPDPDGRYLVPNQGRPPVDGSGRQIPTPDSLGPLGTDQPAVVRRPDGGTTTYRRMPDGDVEVTDRTGDGEVTRWRLHDREDGLTEIDEIGDDGETVDRYFYDPKGEVVDGTADTTSDPRHAEEDQDRSKPSWATLAKVVGLLLLVAAAIAAGAWWWRRRRPAMTPIALDAPPWAIALAARLGHEGRERGRPRASGESVVIYGRELARAALPDPRIAQVAEVVSDALFSGRDPGPEAQAWAESTFEEVVASHPVASKRGRTSREPEPVGP